jgi:steroid 5-alpha reductase family enzyme
MAQFLMINFAAVMGYVTLWYGVALYLKRNDVADIAWGLGFIFTTLVCLAQLGQPIGDRSYLLLGLLSLWGIRLAGYIFIRNRGKEEDFRYANWRKEWGKTIIWRAYLQVFVLQGAILVFIGLPIWYAVANNGSLYWDQRLGVLDILGILIFAKGLIFETVADYQMWKFRKHRKPGQIMNRGVWKYSRHPNYYGESLVWWGLFVICFSAPVPLWTIVSPLMMTFLLVRVSGVPLLEKKYSQNLEYQKYQASTSTFIPWFPNKVAADELGRARHPMGFRKNTRKTAKKK